MARRRRLTLAALAVTFAALYAWVRTWLGDGLFNALLVCLVMIPLFIVVAPRGD